MGTIVDKLNHLTGVKEDIRLALNEQGQLVSSEDDFDTYADKIRAIKKLPGDVCTITLEASDPEGGSVTGGGVASDGMKITVEASPADDHTFEGWKENEAVVHADPAYTFRVNGDRVLTAAFAAFRNFTVSVEPSLTTGGTVTGGGTYQEGDTVTLAYTAAEDYRFVGWYTGNTLLSKENPYTFTAAQNMNITAKCEEVPTRTLTLTPTGISAQNWMFAVLVNEVATSWAGSGASATSPPARPASVKEGTVTVQATSPDGYEFVGWQVGSGSVITDNPYTFTVTGDTTLYCLYEKASRLPDGYTEVEYIQSSTTSRLSSINLGVYISAKSTFEIRGTIPSGYSTNSYLLYGYKYSGGYYYNNLYVTTAELISKIGFFNSSAGTATPIYSSSNLSGDFKITGNGSEKTITYNNVSTTVTTFNGLGDMYLNGNGTTSANGFKGLKVSYIKVSTAGSSNAGEFIPCISPDGVVGLYNVTKSKFCGPVSTSCPWTAGPAV